ncbi:MAG TPA: hypothetical protein VFX15_15505, partial [Actinomycetes bacterium]|nr:hypothetical protein [Actinomycetes bacterium]
MAKEPELIDLGLPEGAITMPRIEKLKVSKRGKPYQVCWSWTDATGKRRFKKERFAKLDQAKAKQRE